MSCLFCNLTCPLGTARCQLETQKIKQVNQKLFMNGYTESIFSESILVNFLKLLAPLDWGPQAPTPSQQSMSGGSNLAALTAEVTSWLQVLHYSCLLSQKTFYLPKKQPKVFHVLSYLGAIRQWQYLIPCPIFLINSLTFKTSNWQAEQ